MVMGFRERRLGCRLYVDRQSDANILKILDRMLVDGSFSNQTELIKRVIELAYQEVYGEAEEVRASYKQEIDVKKLAEEVARALKPEMEKLMAECEADGSDNEQIYPLVLYLSSARLWNENRTGEMSKIPARTDAYQRCLDPKRGNQTSFEYIKLLGNLAAEENDGIPLPAYEVIMNAVRYSLKEELSEGQQVLYSSRYGEIAVKNTDGTVINFSALSDGYRNVIKIVTDIATKMCILNPYLGKDTLILTPGIVVIDELDLSLHPTWQRRIVDILKELFPKVQFICATHSPFIIQSLEPGELITLDSILDEEYSGQSIEDIAEDVMNVKIAQYSEKKVEMYEAAEKYFKALKNAASNEDIEELKDRLDTLSARYSDNPAYNAWMQLKYLEKKAEMKNNATGE